MAKSSAATGGGSPAVFTAFSAISFHAAIASCALASLTKAHARIATAIPNGMIFFVLFIILSSFRGLSDKADLPGGNGSGVRTFLQSGPPIECVQDCLNFNAEVVVFRLCFCEVFLRFCGELCR